MLASLKPTFPEFQELFSNDSTLKILAAIFQMNKKKSSASELASILDIHITTAKKHLETLYNFGFLSKKTLIDKRGKPTYYSIKSDQTVILLDVNILSQTADFQISVPDILIREQLGLYPRVQFIYGKNSLIKSIKIRTRTKAHRTITRELELTANEGMFLKFLPHPTMEPKLLVEICKIAGITCSIQIRAIYNFVIKLRELNIIKCVG